MLIYIENLIFDKHLICHTSHNHKILWLPLTISWLKTIFLFVLFLNILDETYIYYIKLYWIIFYTLLHLGAIYNFMKLLEMHTIEFDGYTKENLKRLLSMDSIGRIKPLRQLNSLHYLVPWRYSERNKCEPVFKGSINVSALAIFIFREL